MLFVLLCVGIWKRCVSYSFEYWSLASLHCIQSWPVPTAWSSWCWAENWNVWLLIS